MADGVPAEVISADSRQVFRGLDIGTAKASESERAGVPHHGLDLVDPDEPFSVAHFVRHANEALERIAARGGVAILAGGTGLYLRAVARGLDADALPADPDTRAAVEGLLAREGLGAAVARLHRLAPKRAARDGSRQPAAGRPGAGDRRARRRRAATAGTRLSGPGGVARASCPWRGAPRWIAARARAQFDSGLVEEARELRERYDPTLPAFSAIGYREAWALLDGEIDRETAIERDAQRNVAFAKRQSTWFRSERDIEWLSLPDIDPLPIARRRALEAA